MRVSAASYSRQIVIARAISWSFCTQRMLLLETGSSSENETKRSNARWRDASRGQKAAPQRKADRERSRDSRPAANACPVVAAGDAGHRPPRVRDDDTVDGDLGMDSVRASPLAVFRGVGHHPRLLGSPRRQSA
jgi:hypothetical protein